MINTIAVLQAVRAIQAQVRTVKDELERVERECHFLYVELSQQQQKEDFERKQIHDIENRSQIQSDATNRPGESQVSERNTRSTGKSKGN